MTISELAELYKKRENRALEDMKIHQKNTFTIENLGLRKKNLDEYDKAIQRYEIYFEMCKALAEIIERKVAEKALEDLDKPEILTTKGMLKEIASITDDYHNSILKD